MNQQVRQLIRGPVLRGGKVCDVPILALLDVLADPLRHRDSAGQRMLLRVAPGCVLTLPRDEFLILFI